VKRSAPAVLAAGVALLLALLAGGAWLILLRAEVDVAPGRPVQVEIREGATPLEAGGALAAKGVVANPAMFRLQVQMAGVESQLQAGVYDLQTGMTYADVIEALREGPPVELITLVIPEGWTIQQVAARVQEKTGIPKAEFTELAAKGAKSFSFPFLESNPTDSLEGYLFPKTYRVAPGATAREVVQMMLAQFGEETSGLDLSNAASHGATMHGLVTIGSMVERETKTSADRALVASVIYNRLAKGMYLEIDATVQYVLGNKPRLLYSDLKVRSPYNTYLNKGLPPGPIASPGLASLQAAAAPADTGYLYYVLTHKDGSHSFALTREEFLRLKAQAKKGLK
jgi:UPF0755 protein